MTFYRSLSAVLVSVCWVLLSVAEEDNSTETRRTAATNSSRVNAINGTSKGPLNTFNVDSSMIQRALYVLVGITIIGVLYFLIRAVRLKKPTHRKKYGLLSNEDDAVEMDAVDSDEDDTLYESRSLRSQSDWCYLCLCSDESWSLSSDGSARIDYRLREGGRSDQRLAETSGNNKQTDQIVTEEKCQISAAQGR
uniref:Uncharacterized protein n=1 Tax=Astatotilapia calliptera TaxID=8154 RepID=A0AAX7SW41_ASTCA